MILIIVVYTKNTALSNLLCHRRIGTYAITGENIMKKLSTAITVVTLCATLSILCGCNTVNGIGKDVSSTGRAIQKAS